MDTIISVGDLRKSYAGTEAVRGVSFTVERGEIFGLLGPNGAGKTTIVEILQGLRRPDTGRIRVLGEDPGRSPSRLRRRIGSQLQSSSLPARLRVAEAVRLFASLAGSPVPAEQLVSEWDLTPIAGTAFAALSGGQRQRLFLALALVNDPELVFLDELTTGMDPAARRATWHLVRRVRDRGATVVLVTHFMDEAEQLCDRLAVVDRGQVVARGTPDEVTRHAVESALIRFRAPRDDVAFLVDLPTVHSVSRHSDGVVIRGDRFAVFDVAAALARRGIRPYGFRTTLPTLEDAFLDLTRR